MNTDEREERQGAPERIFLKACHPASPNHNCTWDVSKTREDSVEYVRANLLDSQAAGGDAQVLNDIRQRVADGYESASSRNVITVAALTLKDLHYVLSSHDGQFIRGATRMREACVEKVKAMAEQWRLEASKAGRMFSDKTAIATKIAAELESLTLDSTDQMKEKQ